MDEGSKYTIGIGHVLKALKKDVENLFEVDISKKCRTKEYIKARSAFIHILKEKYNPSIEKIYDSSILTEKILNDFLGIGRANIYNYSKKFKNLINDSNSFHAKYNILYNKWVKRDIKFLEINRRIESLRKELEELTRRFDETYKMLII